MDSPICLYTKVALTTSLLTSSNWKHVSFTFAILKDYCGSGEERKWGSGDLLPENLMRIMPSKTSENALLIHKVKVAIIIEF